MQSEMIQNGMLTPVMQRENSKRKFIDLFIFFKIKFSSLAVDRPTVSPVLPGLVPELLQRLLALGPLQHQSPPVQVSAVDEALEGRLGVTDGTELYEGEPSVFPSPRHLAWQSHSRQLSECSEELRDLLLLGLEGDVPHKDLGGRFAQVGFLFIVLLPICVGSS